MLANRVWLPSMINMFLGTRGLVALTSNVKIMVLGHIVWSVQCEEAWGHLGVRASDKI
jgi:hypothetical protein